MLTESTENSLSSNAVCG